ncbi:MAG: glycoside hydrolase family 31 protein [Myxococcaceae bacterium]
MHRALVVAGLVLVACNPRPPDIGGFTLPVTDAKLQVKGPGSVTLDSYPGTQAYAPAAVRTASARYEMMFGSWKITDQPNAWREAKKFEWRTVKTDSANGAFLDANGKVLVTLDVSSGADGALSMFVKSADTTVNRLSIAFACSGEDAFLGFGGQQDALDHRGHTVPIWTSEPGIGKDITDDNYPDIWFLEGTRHASSYGIPTWYSNRGYVGVVETDRRSIFELCSAKQDAWRVEVWDNQFTIHLFAGNASDAPLTQATRAVLGLPKQPPLMAFAPWNDAIFGSANVRRFADELRDAGIPSSVIWTEDFRGATDSSDGKTYKLREAWDLDPTLYPDAGEVAASLQRDGFAWFAYFNTFLVQGEQVFDEAADGGYFVMDQTGAPYLFTGVGGGPTGLADLSNPQARDWVKAHMRKALDVGFTGWMADFGEWLPHDAKLASGEDPLAAHNRYARDWNVVNEEVLAERANDGKQYLFFARSGWLGSSTHTPVLWAGDQRTDFEPDDGFPTVVPYGLGLGLAGVSTYGTDIAGYQSATNPVSTKELFFRWTTLGAFTPVMRTHHGSDARHSWKLDSDAETMAHWARWARFHISLIPFLDGLSAIAETKGIPPMRALALEFPQDAAGWKVDDEWMLGDGVLVAPVLTQGSTSRDVYFPPGKWVSLDGTRKVSGGGHQQIDAALTEIPVFLLAGTVVPRAADGTMTALPSATAKSYDPSVRKLLVVGGSEGSFTERDGTAYQVSTASGTAFAESAPLGDCSSATQRGCVDRSGPNPVARMAGAGPLDFPGGHLVVTGAAKTLDVEVISAL